MSATFIAESGRGRVCPPNPRRGRCSVVRLKEPWKTARSAWRWIPRMSKLGTEKRRLAHSCLSEVGVPCLGNHAG